MLQLFGVSAVSHMSTNVLIGTVCIILSVALLLLSEMVWYQHAWVSVRRRRKIEVDQSKRNVFNTGDANAVAFAVPSSPAGAVDAEVFNVSVIRRFCQVDKKAATTRSGVAQAMVSGTCHRRRCCASAN